MTHGHTYMHGHTYVHGHTYMHEHTRMHGHTRMHRHACMYAHAHLVARGPLAVNWELLLFLLRPLSVFCSGLAGNCFIRWIRSELTELGETGTSIFCVTDASRSRLSRVFGWWVSSRLLIEESELSKPIGLPGFWADIWESGVSWSWATGFKACSLLSLEWFVSTATLLIAYWLGDPGVWVWRLCLNFCFICKKRRVIGNYKQKYVYVHTYM